MKNFSRSVVFLMFFILGSSLIAQGSVSVKAYGDFSGKAKMEFEDGSSTDESDVLQGYSVAIDLMLFDAGNLSVGAGAAYELPRGIDVDEGLEESGKFNFIPLYGVVKFNLTDGDFRPVLFGQVGYNLFQGDEKFTKIDEFNSLDLKGGLYWGAGLDIEFGSFVVGAVYRYHKGEVSFGEATSTFYYKTISAGVGFNF